MPPTRTVRLMEAELYPVLTVAPAEADDYNALEIPESLLQRREWLQKEMEKNDRAVLEAARGTGKALNHLMDVLEEYGL